MIDTQLTLPADQHREPGQELLQIEEFQNVCQARRDLVFKLARAAQALFFEAAIAEPTPEDLEGFFEDFVRRVLSAGRRTIQ